MKRKQQGGTISIQDWKGKLQKVGKKREATNPARTSRSSRLTKKIGRSGFQVAKAKPGGGEERVRG